MPALKHSVRACEDGEDLKGRVDNVWERKVGLLEDGGNNMGERQVG